MLASVAGQADAREGRLLHQAACLRVVTFRTLVQAHRRGCACCGRDDMRAGPRGPGLPVAAATGFHIRGSAHAMTSGPAGHFAPASGARGASKPAVAVLGASTDDAGCLWPQRYRDKIISSWWRTSCRYMEAAAACHCRDTPISADTSGRRRPRSRPECISRVVFRKEGNLMVDRCRYLSTQVAWRFSGRAEIGLEGKTCGGRRHVHWA